MVWWKLVVVMALAGVLGGFVNYFVVAQDEKSDWRWKLARSLTLGLGAAFMVPVFLNTISSDLIKQIIASTGPTEVIPDTFVLAALCVIAAASATALIRAVTQAMIRKLEERTKRAEERSEQAEQKAEQAGEEAGAVARSMKLEEPPVKELNAARPPSPTVLEGLSLDQRDVEILKALDADKYSYRTVGGIVQDSKLDEDDALKRLFLLRDKALVARKTTTTREFWFLTGKGHDWLEVKGLARGRGEGLQGNS